MYKCRMANISLLAVVCIFFVLKFGEAKEPCTAIDQCSCKLSSGPIITLWDIDKRYDISGIEAGFSYLFHPCTGLEEPKTVCDGSLGCQIASSDQSKVLIAKKPDKVTAIVDASGLYAFKYTGGVDQTTQQTITLKLLLQCNENEKAKFTKMFGCVADNCILTLESKCACPGHCSIPSSSSSSSKSHSLSTGSILCIILFVLVIVYIFAGVAINKFALHKEGSDVIPQRSFWSDIPSLIKDGCVFTFHKARRGKGEYEEI